MLIGGVTSGESNDHLVRLLHILVANETNMGLNASNRPLFPAPLGDTKYIENHRRWAGEMPGIGANDKRCPPNRFQACGRIIVHARHGSLFIQRDLGNSDDRRRSRSNSRRVPGQRSHIGRRRHPSALCPDSGHPDQSAFRKFGRAGALLQFRFAIIYRRFMDEDIVHQAIARTSSPRDLFRPRYFLDQKSAAISFTGSRNLSDRIPDRSAAPVSTRDMLRICLVRKIGQNVRPARRLDHVSLHPNRQ